MAGTIEHYWNGTILTVISDSGTSSCDLAGEKGDTGPRGPQGPAGDIGLTGERGEQGVQGEQGPAGEIDYSLLEGYLPLAGGKMTGGIDMNVNKISKLDSPVNAMDAANKEYVDSAIANAVSSGTIDLRAYATKDYVDEANKETQKLFDNYATKEYVDGKPAIHFSEAIPTEWKHGDIWLKPVIEG